MPVDRECCSKDKVDLARLKRRLAEVREIDCFDALSRESVVGLIRESEAMQITLVKGEDWKTSEGDIS